MPCSVRGKHCRWAGIRESERILHGFIFLPDASRAEHCAKTHACFSTKLRSGYFLPSSYLSMSTSMSPLRVTSTLLSPISTTAPMLPLTCATCARVLAGVEQLQLLPVQRGPGARRRIAAAYEVVIRST